MTGFPGHRLTHMAVGFLLMGIWAAWANRTHPVPAPLIAGLLQGVLTALITGLLKAIMDWLFDRLSVADAGGAVQCGHDLCGDLYRNPLDTQGQPMSDDFSRRPIASRSSGWAQALARRLAGSAMTPNQISQASVGFALVAGLAFWTSAGTGPVLGGILLIFGAAACQARLVCNLIDGMVAIEGGQKAPDGPFWNEAPDRIADILILAGIGLAAHQPALGWAAATLAVLTAYLRELGRAEGMAADFGGPLAKPQRMAVASAGAVIAAFIATNWVLTVTLWVLVVGTALTAALRAARLVSWLRQRT